MRCKECEKDFKDLEALNMHVNDIHGSRRVRDTRPFKEKWNNLPWNKKAAYIGYLIGFSLIAWGLFRMVST